MELGETTTRLTEITITVQALTNDKRRMEADIAAMQSDLDEALNGQRAAEDRADRLQAEVNRLADELRQEQDNYKNAESLRKQLEIEIREITVRLEEAEAFAQREGKRAVAKLQARVRTTLHPVFINTTKYNNLQYFSMHFGVSDKSPASHVVTIKQGRSLCYNNAYYVYNTIGLRINFASTAQITL